MSCNIVIAGNGIVTDLFIERITSDDRFTISGFLPCPVQREYVVNPESIMRQAPIVDYDGLDRIQNDMIIAFEYRKLIPDYMVKKHFFVNCHAGILPKYRGFSSNAWAIMNGEKYIGYSIHRMNEKMDDGDLYYVKRIPIDYTQTYSDVHEIMINDILDNTPDILIEIYNGSRKAEKQEGDRIYGHRFSRKTGIISDFNVTSTYLYNLYRCMAKPLGTGIRIIYDGEEYDVNTVVHGREYSICDYVGIPGMIVNIEDDSLWVKTSDNVIVLKEIYNSSKEKICVNSIFRIGSCLAK